MAGGNLMECKMEIQDQVLKRETCLKKTAEIIVSKFTHYASKENNKQAVLKSLDDMLNGYTDAEKYTIMQYVYLRLV